MVNLKNCNIESFFRLCKGRRVYVFGVAASLKMHKAWRTPDYDFSYVVFQFVDNDNTKWNTSFHLESVCFDIISPQELCSNISKEDIVLIASGSYVEIVAQLDSYKELNDVACYILHFIDDYADSILKREEYIKARGEKFNIPPVIHYCWFGGNPLPVQYEKYIESWRKYCPEYEVIKWDEHNYDIRKHPYLRWAYDNKKWAFLSDYARLDIIYKHGGIYLDTDVELIKSLDEVRKFHAFIGYESTQMLNTGLGFGAERGHEMIQCLRDSYDFVDTENSLGVEPCTVYQTRDLKSFGLRGDNSFQLLQKGRMAVLPTEFLCGIRLYTRERQITEYTCALHHYSGDWGGKGKKTTEELISYSLPLLERVKTKNI